MTRHKRLVKYKKMVETYQIESIAIGNGTAGRETEHFIQNIHYDRDVKSVCSK